MLISGVLRDLLTMTALCDGVPLSQFQNERYHRSGERESSGLKRLLLGGVGELVSMAAGATAADVAEWVRLRGGVELWCCICSSRKP